jgi:hypothetical protein
MIRQIKAGVYGEYEIFITPQGSFCVYFTKYSDSYVARNNDHFDGLDSHMIFNIGVIKNIHDDIIIKNKKIYYDGEVFDVLAYNDRIFTSREKTRHTIGVINGPNCEFYVSMIL